MNNFDFDFSLVLAAAFLTFGIILLAIELITSAFKELKEVKNENNE